MTLNQLARPMSVPFSTRRAAQAPVLTLSLTGCRASTMNAADVAESHVKVPLGRLSLWATRCDAPVLIEEAAAAARVSLQDVLILRLGTGAASPPVLFDWVPNAGLGRIGLVPALPAGGGLSLADPKQDDLRLDVTGDGILDRTDVAPGWALERVLAVARAAAIFRSNLWGGL
jgi:hypothetical protein